MNELRISLINTFWYFARVYMNFPNDQMDAIEVISSKLGKASDLNKILDKIDEKLQEYGLPVHVERNPNMTLQDLLTQIDNVIKQFENGQQI